MRQYIYRPQELGLDRWPEGTLRLEGIEVTDNPKDADVFTVPGSMDLFRRGKRLSSLPHFRGNEARHVLFDCSDHEELYSQPCLFIRCNTRTWYYEKDINTISWPWPVDDHSKCADVPEGGFKYDVSFQGWNWSDARKVSVKSCLKSDLSCDIATYDDFCGYIWDTEEGLRRRREFRRSMKESRIALCPESIPGVFPYRFFEALSAGRIPLLVGSDYVLPWRDEIPYEDFIITLEAREAYLAGRTIKDFLARTCDHELIERGKVAQYYFQRWLWRDNWPMLMAEAVRRKVDVACASR